MRINTLRLKFESDIHLSTKFNIANYSQMGDTND